MKTKKLSILLILMGLIGGLVWLSRSFNRATVVTFSPATALTNEKDGSLQMAISDTTNLIPSSADSESVELFKTPLDLVSGKYAFVGEDKKVVKLKNSEGAILWSADLQAITENLTLRVIGKKEVSSIKTVGLELEIKYGKAVVSLDSRTGKFIGFFSD